MAPIVGQVSFRNSKLSESKHMVRQNKETFPDKAVCIAVWYSSGQKTGDITLWFFCAKCVIIFVLCTQSDNTYLVVLQ